MANTPNLDLENVNVLLDTDSAYNQIIEIINKLNGNNLKIDELPNNFIPSSQKGAINGVATLGGDGIIPSDQLPLDSGSVERVVDIIARDAIVNLYDNKLVFVIDATGDITVTAGWAMYIYSIASLSWTKIIDAESLDLELTWDNIENRPTTFPPAPHTHEQIETNRLDIEALIINKVDKIIGSRLVSETEITVFNDKYSKVEVDNKLSALETNTDWKESVATFTDIATTYPTPVDGWTVNVKDTDYTYRYNGTEWVAISANAIPKATTSVDGLMTKELVTQVNTNKTDILSAKTTLGSVAMTTSAQTVTGAINELDADIGDKSTLTTDVKTNLVNAINEHEAQINSLGANKADLIDGKVPTSQLPDMETPVKSVNGKIGSVVLTKSDVGLGNVDNTADSTKAVLSATKLGTVRQINGVAFDGTENITVQDNTKAPINHASTGVTYGVGTSANYGHVKVRNDLNGTETSGATVSPAQIKILNDKIDSKGSMTSGQVTYTDSIPANGTLTKTIPIGDNKSQGRAIIYSSTSYVHENGIVLFNTDTIETVINLFDGWQSKRRQESIGSKRGLTGNDNVGFTEFYISGTNLRITFKNTSSGILSLDCNIAWEVW